MGRPASVEAHEVFWDCWRQGLSVAECSARAGVTVTAGDRWAQVAGVARPAHRPVADPVKVAALVKLIRSGVAGVAAAKRVGLSRQVGRYWAARLADGVAVPNLVWVDYQTGGVDIDMDAPPGRRLGPRERQEIALGRAAGLSISAIAERIGRPRCTVWRELTRNSSPDGTYRFLDAEQSARDKAKRPKVVKLAEGRLRDMVQQGLEHQLSPEQISHRLVLEYPDDKEMRVCCETIYQAVYVQARGGLKREVNKALRTSRTIRKPHATGEKRRGRIADMTPISQRPAQVEERTVPGHWEGDLILGSVESKSAVATLIERCFRFALVAGLPNGHTAAQTEEALVPVIAALPEQLRNSLTWDQGVEMSNHLQIANQTGITIYFADPHSPWQRGTNENTNGLLRQYLPKGTDLSVYTPEDLAAIATALNTRPRKTLGWLTPAEAFAIWLGIPVTIGGRPAQLPDSLKPLTHRCVDH